MTRRRASVVERLHAALLRLYPAAFRDEHARDMQSDFRLQWRDARGAGIGAQAALLSGTVNDAIASSLRAQVETTIRDVRHAWRSLAAPGHRLVSAAGGLTLALAIASVAVVYTIAHAVLFAPLPFVEPHRLVRVWDVQAEQGKDAHASSTPNFRSLRERTRTLSSLVAIRVTDSAVNVSGGGAPERVPAVAASAELWRTLGLAPIAGRAFTSDDEAQRARVVMIGEGLWQRRFARSSAAIGSTIDVNRQAHTIVGVAPRDAGFATDVDVWLPLGVDPEVDNDRGDRRLALIGRLAPGASLARAQDEISRLGADLAREFPRDNGGWTLRMTPVRDWIVEADVARRLRVLLAAVGLLLLVAITNVAALQAARAGARLRDAALRLALGASQARLLRQALTEHLLLAIAGGAAGLGLAWAGVRVAVAALPATAPRVATIAPGWTSVAAAAAAVVVSTIVAGLLPALFADRRDLRLALQQAGRTTTARAPLRRALVAVQLTLTTTLVVGAALMAQSFLRLHRVDPGFANPDRLLTAQLARPVESEADHARHLAFYDALLADVRALPGVRAAAIASEAPFGDLDTIMALGPIPMGPHVPENGVAASWRIVSPEYFDTMRIPVRDGRTFEAGRDPAKSLVVSERLARRLWPGRSPVGRRVWLNNGNVFTVVGVVGDVRQAELDAEPAPAIYMPTWWYLWPTMTLVVRSEVEPLALSPAIRGLVTRRDPLQPIAAFQTLDERIGSRAATPRLNAMAAALFAGLALILAIVGVAGVVGHAVGQRASELALRQALGASPRQAVRHVMRDGLTLCAAGIAIGLGISLFTGDVLSRVLYNVRPNDPRTLVAVSAALALAATLACWLPARRAAAISPSRLLR